MQLHEEAEDGAGPSGYVEEAAGVAEGGKPDEAIFTCKFPGCTRQYASTDGVRKHCRKSHPEWLREVDLDKANLGCRWAAYCTREPITESNDPRTTPVGSKRAREIMAQGGALPPLQGGLASALKATGTATYGAESSSTSHRVAPNAAAVEQEAAPPPRPEPKAPRHAPHGVAMDGKSALVPLRAPPSRARSENMMPPEMIALPGELSTPLPANVSALTPNAEKRARLGEIADSESLCLQPPTNALQPHALPSTNSFFVHWGMPPLKRGLSLADTREAAAQHAMMATAHAADDDASVSHDSPSFLDSVLA